MGPTWDPVGLGLVCHRSVSRKRATPVRLQPRCQPRSSAGSTVCVGVSLVVGDPAGDRPSKNYRGGGPATTMVLRPVPAPHPVGPGRRGGVARRPHAAVKDSSEAPARVVGIRSPLTLRWPQPVVGPPVCPARRASDPAPRVSAPDATCNVRRWPRLARESRAAGYAQESAHSGFCVRGKCAAVCGEPP